MQFEAIEAKKFGALCHSYSESDQTKNGQKEIKTVSKLVTILQTKKGGAN